MSDYKEMYYHLFLAITDVLPYIESDPVRAKLDLKLAQAEAEELYLQQEE